MGGIKVNKGGEIKVNPPTNFKVEKKNGNPKNPTIGPIFG